MTPLLKLDRSKFDLKRIELNVDALCFFSLLQQIGSLRIWMMLLGQDVGRKTMKAIRTFVLLKF